MEEEGEAAFRATKASTWEEHVPTGWHLLFLAAPPPQPLRVPSLLNVAATPPYFHDGSATSL